MLKFFLVTCQQLTLCTALLCALYALLKVCASHKEIKSFKYALIAALVLSAAFAVFKQNVRFQYQEQLNLALLSVTFICLAALGILMWLDRLAPAGRFFIFPGVLCLGLYALPLFLLNPTDFVLSNQSMFSADFLYCALGELFALVVLFIYGWGIYRLTSIVQGIWRKVLCSLIIGCYLLSVSGVLLQLLMARRILPMNSELFALMRLAVNHPDFLALLLSLVIIIPAAAVFIYYLKLHGTFANPAQQRILRAFSLSSRRAALFTMAACMIIALDLTVVKSWQNRGFELSPAESFTLRDGVIHIPLEQISDKHLHRFEHTASNGATVRFIVIQKQGSAFGVGFDACEICGATGYYERDGQVVCMLCDVVMNINTIGYKGGCNPIPLAYRIENGELIIDEKALDAEMRRFK